MAKELVQQLILEALDKDGTIEDTRLINLEGSSEPVDQNLVLGVLNALQSRDMVLYEPLERDVWHLTEEGLEVVASGSHEVKVFHAIPPGDEGLPIADLPRLVGEASAKVGQGKAFKNKWIKKAGSNIVRQVSEVEDQTRKDLTQLQQAKPVDADTLKELKRRNLCDKQKEVSFKVRKGSQFSTVVAKQATDLTAEMLQGGAWKTQSFKKYNFDTAGIVPEGGQLHPLMKVREEFRQIFFEMGFKEMPTNRFVESSFWNFDTLFQPQQHPARDAHDTFFLKDPASSADLPQDLLDKVKQVHAHGGYGSIGYRYDWKTEEAEKLILRTHTTAVSSWMLHKLAQQKEFEPVRYFSIDRVFRNETVDATHLAEFHQVEGVIADRGLTLGDLIGFMDIFFRKMGITKLRFKPAYNPYTEPSMEIFSWHSGFKKWVEIGNSGMFRPEMLGPLGLPPDVRVIAWGLGLERPTMIKYGIDNIRDLLGHKVDLAMIKANPICRLDKKMGKEIATS